MKYILTISNLIFCFLSFSQQTKSFEGTLTYRIEMMDSTLQKGSYLSQMVIHTNDTLIRIDTESQNLGKQTTIRNIALNKQYILLELNGKKYAIQHTLKQDSLSDKYTYTFQRRKKRFAGIVSKKVIVHSNYFPKPLAMYYSRDLKPTYLQIFKGMPGLPTMYYIPTENGILKYTLTNVKNYSLDKKTFYFGKEYEKISFDDFINQFKN